MAGPLECLHVWTLGGVEDLLVGGEERQPLANLRHGVFGDVPGVVGVHVHVLQVCQGLHIGPVHLVDQVQCDVKEVCHPGVDICMIFIDIYETLHECAKFVK